MEKIDNIYDKLFKVIFTDRKNTKDFLKIYLPEDLKKHIADFRLKTDGL